ncbi:hypothetical protein BH23GEM9_BH23GEM9_12760 [soil metagenome]
MSALQPKTKESPLNRRQGQRFDGRPREILERLTRVAGRGLSAEGSFIALAADPFVIIASHGLPLQLGDTAPWSESRLRQVVENAAAVAVADDAGLAEGGELPTARAILALPLIRTGEGPAAVLCVVDSRPRRWNDEEVAMLRDAAASATHELELLDELATARRENAERTAIMAATASGIIGIDMDARVSFTNARAAELLGRADSDVVGTLLGELLPEVAADPLHLTNDVRATHTGTGYALRPDGSSLPIDFSIWPIVQDDAVTGAAINFSDTTSREQAEAGLRESEERYGRLFELLPDALVVVAHGRISFVNPAAVRLAEASSTSEMIGRRITDFVPPELSMLLEEWMTRAMRRSEPAGSQPMEVPFLRADGSRVPVEMSSIPLLLRGERCLQIVIRDLSSQTAAGAARHRSEEQLRQSQKMEAIGRLAGGIAHDFNNMLTAIRGFASLLEPQLETDSTGKLYIEEIHNATDRAVGLTRQLLAFSRRQLLNPVVLDVNGTIRDMSEQVQLLIGSDVELVLDLSPEAGHARVDQAQFEQALLNLGENARDAMTDGGVLTITTRNTWLDENFSRGRFALEPGAYVLIAVADTGHGMDAGTLERAFEPFFTTKAARRGAGLGLATVYGFVKQSNGFVWAESKPGHGATLTVYLPSIEAEPAVATKGSEIEATAPASGTILLVEDEPAVRLLTRTLLMRNGYHVLTAEDGEIALQVAAQYDGRIHLLLTDVVMPRMGGRELADRLSPLRPDMKVVYFSGYAEHAIAGKGALEENRVLLQKPFTPETLLAAVRSVGDTGACRRL